MMFKRLAANLHSQNWSAVAVEFVMVVLGVFLGVAAANWNEERLERREIARLLRQVDAELTTFLSYIDGVGDYYRSAGGYADRANAGWDGNPEVSDNDFVIAAYQASQVTGIGPNIEVWSTIFGADQLRQIDDPRVRQSLAQVMSFDYSLVDLKAVATRYREEVRKIIPEAVQRRIRETCGDRLGPRPGWVLPRTCDLQIEPATAARVAAALRAERELQRELQWHRAAVANQLAQAGNLRDWVVLFTTRVES
jgi:hypothetical protein